jgi:hypothetical protein
MFIKRGDGQILGVVETEELTDEQKKLAKNLSAQTIKQSNTESDKSKKDESGRN